jgi:hypothetical protein
VTRAIWTSVRWIGPVQGRKGALRNGALFLRSSRNSRVRQQSEPLVTNRSRWNGSVLAVCCVSAGTACTHGLFPSAAPNISLQPDDRIETRLILIGDAGEPNSSLKDVLKRAGQDASDAGVQNPLVVFLGDNVYEKGVGPTKANQPESEWLPDATERLTAQLRLLQFSSVIFVPGNHDWDQTSGKTGGVMPHERILREERLVADLASQMNDRRPSATAEFLPGNGCPGPAYRDVGQQLRLIALDTEWLLTEGRGEAGAVRTSACLSNAQSSGPDAVREVFRRVSSLIVSAGARKVVLVGHHPLHTHGGHGYPLRFLLTEDLNSSRYRRFRGEFERAIQASKPLVVAAGHEHTLQVLREPHDAVTHVVSGSSSKQTGASVGSDTLMKSGQPGYARIDFHAFGAVSLDIIHTTGTSANSRGAVWSGCLAAPCAAAKP